jgi:14-3-3 protein epsilon
MLHLYRERIEKELNAICGEVIRIIDDKLLSNAEDIEATVWFLKMKADFYRYLAEFQTIGRNKARYKNASTDGATSSYDEA